MRSRKDMIGILGGGISGLSAAHYLLKAKSHMVTLLEASHRVGGWVKTSLSPSGNIFEHGPRTIRVKGAQGENTLLLIKELGLAKKILPITSSHPAAKKRMVYVDKHLHVLPSNLFSLLLAKPPFTKPVATAVLRDMWAPKKELEDESIYDFVERRLGKELAEYAISPLICGICAGDSKQISVKFLMKSMFEAEQEHGSILKGMIAKALSRRNPKTPPNDDELCKLSKKENWAVWSLEGGMQELPKALERSVRHHGGDLVLNAHCKEMEIVPERGVAVQAGHQSYYFKHVISALPSTSLASIVKKQHPKLSSELAAIPSVTVGLVNLQYDEHVLSEEAFGFLVPPSQELPILGIVFDSCCFPRGNKTVITVMMGGAWFNKYFGVNPKSDALLDTALEQTSNILGISVKPTSHSVSILENCIPQYLVGHHDRVKRIRGYIEKHKLPLSLVGASYDGVGVNDVIYSSRLAVENLAFSETNF